MLASKKMAGKDVFRTLQGSAAKFPENDAEEMSLSNGG